MKIAFVAPFYGAQAAGGAEAECRQTALHLAERGVDVDILTTCLLDLQHDWNIDAYPEGTHPDGKLLVHRFRAEKVHRPVFDRLNNLVMTGMANERAADRFAALHINSFDLLQFLSRHADNYDWICFIPYLFGTSIHGSRICPEKSVLIPCLHDEGYARMERVREMFGRCARIVFHTAAEQRLAHQLYGDAGKRGLLIGEGVETRLVADGDRFRKKYGVTGPYVLYCGRKDVSKNTPELVDYFARSRSFCADQVQLLLIGPGSVSIPEQASHGIIDLGFIPAQDKLDAYAAADVFCQPSLNESFSLVLMEAWDLGVPTLVNGRCEVMKDHVVEAGGGLYYKTFADFDDSLSFLLEHKAVARSMGVAGRDYVRCRYSWDRIIDRYLGEVFVR